MKPIEIFGLLLGGFGILVLDLGFSGSAMTDLFYITSPIKSSIATAIMAPPNGGVNLLGNVLPAGNSSLFLIGGGILGVAMIILILHNRNSGKPSIGAVPPNEHRLLN
jgi:hypothetical protein